MPEKHYEWKLGKALPSLGPHSLAKHRILRRYLERYIEIVTANSQQEELRMTLVDGYCGGGRYQCGRELVEGSPFIFLESISSMEAKLNLLRPKGFKINVDYIFIDSNKDHIDFLRSEIEKTSFSGELEKTIFIWHADFNERIDEVLRVVKARSPVRGRSIFLLDQYGWSQVAFTSIRKILNDLQKAEIFLTFSVDALISYISDQSFSFKAFGEIDVNEGLIKEMIQTKNSDQSGYRAAIQNTLYEHIQKMTGAPFYSPFFIKSPDANRSYWFLHLSKHREARNEIGMIHWSENNTTVHHGGAGLNALGFSTGRNIDQLTMSYLFDDHAKQLSRQTLHRQIPELILQATEGDVPPTLEELFGLRCNDTPVVREILEEALLQLRSEKEIIIADAEGKVRPRTNSIAWTDKIIKPRQKSFFSVFGEQKSKP